jgi:hypothetical protein
MDKRVKGQKNVANLKINAVKVWLVLSVVLFSAAVEGRNNTVLADSWYLPKQTKYCSPNKKFCLEVTPKKLESQINYFQNKVDRTPNAGADNSAPKNFCKGKFLVRNSLGVYRAKTAFSLVNEVAPVEAIVSDDGNFFVTFDNWHAVGYGKDVVAIYRSDGKLVRKLALEDIFTASDIETFSLSASSRHWGKGHFIDDKKGVLVLKAVTNQQPLYANNAQFRKIRIDLASGNLSEAKKDILPRYEFRVSILSSDSQPASVVNASQMIWRCAKDDFDPELIGATNLTDTQITRYAIQKPAPKYPPIAMAAHATGTVVTELLILESGDVFCARALEGHALLREATVRTALQWKFLAGSEKRNGKVSFSFQRVFIDPLEATKDRQ